MDGPTHYLGHTLDLIISHWLFISLREISETAISDHFPIIFEFRAHLSASKPLAPACRHCILTSSTTEEFAAAFMDSQFFALRGWFLLYAQIAFFLLFTPPVPGSWILLLLFIANLPNQEQIPG